jgi:hypothetical protein
MRGSLDESPADPCNGNSEAVSRFAREARAAVKIESEHVARVMNVGTLPNGAPYMVTGEAGTSGIIYEGGTAVAGSCATTFEFDGVSNSWFSYSDGTGNTGSFSPTADQTGCEGPDTCAFHTSGSGFTGYGAGAGFTLNNNATFDASSFTGLNVHLKGTTRGTRGANFTESSNTVHVKFVTEQTDGADPPNGDDYGFFCTIEQAGSCYSRCQIPFMDLAREAYDAGVAGMPPFTPSALVKIQFEFDAYSMTTDSGASLRRSASTS